MSTTFSRQSAAARRHPRCSAPVRRASSARGIHRRDGDGVVQWIKVSRRAEAGAQRAPREDLLREGHSRLVNSRGDGAATAAETLPGVKVCRRSHSAEHTLTGLKPRGRHRRLTDATERGTTLAPASGCSATAASATREGDTAARRAPHGRCAACAARPKPSSAGAAVPPRPGCPRQRSRARDSVAADVDGADRDRAIPRQLRRSMCSAVAEPAGSKFCICAAARRSAPLRPSRARRFSGLAAA